MSFDFNVANILHESASLLIYGPLGLLALIVVLTVVAACVPRSEGRSAMLKWVLVFNTFCFVVAVIPQYVMMAYPDSFGGAARTASLQNAVRIISDDLPTLQGVNTWLNGSICSGGAHGVPADGRAAPSSNLTKVIADLSDAKARAESTLPSLRAELAAPAK